ncbi:MAG: magnesium/cobalt transporter CorA [Acidobacteria bacterium]|nr:magnesium/cobalt transporter CorA [Acidobacteriota bacterium]
MIVIYVHEGGSTRSADRVDPAWLVPGSQVSFWVDLQVPTAEESRILADVFAFHELAIEDAIAETLHPKVESYGSYLYIILHGIDFQAVEHRFQTIDVDFFLGPNYLVTVHGGVSRSIGHVADICARNSPVLSEGPAALMHRIVDTMVDNYRPEVDKLSDRLDDLEGQVFEGADPSLARRILEFKRDVISLRRVVLPQRDVVGRLARREFPFISESLAYRFRDVHDHLVRLTDESMQFADRVSTLFEAHLAMVSNQLNGVMKVLTIIATVFMPLTVLTGMYGMNVDLPRLPGGEPVQFWWVIVIMLVLSFGMLGFFRRRGWI